MNNTEVRGEVQARKLGNRRQPPGVCVNRLSTEPQKQGYIRHRVASGAGRLPGQSPVANRSGSCTPSCVVLYLETISKGDPDVGGRRPPWGTRRVPLHGPIGCFEIVSYGRVTAGEHSARDAQRSKPEMPGC